MHRLCKYPSPHGTGGLRLRPFSPFPDNVGFPYPYAALFHLGAGGCSGRIGVQGRRPGYRASIEPCCSAQVSPLKGFYPFRAPHLGSRKRWLSGFCDNGFSEYTEKTFQESP